VILRRIYDATLAQAAYLVGCPATREAILIDPACDIDRYLAIAAEENLRIVAVAETHVHADFVSGVCGFLAHHPVTAFVSAEGPAQRWMRSTPLAAGARIERSVEGDRGGVVRRVAIRIDPMQARTAVRELWVECDFDGEPTIRMPLGHFIGLGESTGPTADAFRAVGPDGSMEFRLPMPFARSARVAIANRGAAPLACALEIFEADEIVAVDPRGSAAPPQLLHGAVRIHDRVSVERPVELELARIEGRGTLVGESEGVGASRGQVGTRVGSREGTGVGKSVGWRVSRGQVGTDVRMGSVGAPVGVTVCMGRVGAIEGNGLGVRVVGARLG
jgi:hypothetical protein